MFRQPTLQHSVKQAGPLTETLAISNAAKQKKRTATKKKAPARKRAATKKRGA